jgi:hypothetical protein
MSGVGCAITKVVTIFPFRKDACPTGFLTLKVVTAVTALNNFKKQ